MLWALVRFAAYQAWLHRLRSVIVTEQWAVTDRCGGLLHRLPRFVRRAA